MRRFGLFSVCAALFLSLGGPALANHTAEHAAEQIDQIVAEAIQQMRSRVDEFEARVQSATSEGEINELRQAARSGVHEIWSMAETEVQETAKGYDSELGSDVAQAKQELVGARNDARSDIDAAAEAAIQNLAPATTTTTVQITTTTVQSPASTGAQGPTTTTQADVTTTEGGSGAPSGGATPPPPPQTPLERWAANAFVSGQPEADDDSAPTRSGVVVVLDTVLPRDLIDWAMSPFRMIWVIVRTTVDGGREVLYPASALAMSTVALVVIEARFRQRASSRRIISTG